MSSRITADLQRVDRAIRPGVSHRSLFKSGSIEAWNACLSSLQATQQILIDSGFADQNGSAATWIHWRKSSTSKQLLGLLRATVEEAPGSALTAGCIRECALHVGLGVISFLFKRTQYGALWPAMREWLVDHSGLRDIWLALAWSMALVSEDQAAHDGALRVQVQAVIGLMKSPDKRLLTLPVSAHPSITAALTLLFRDSLPRDLGSENAHEWRMGEVLAHVASISEQLCRSQPQLQLHRAFIVAWPHLMGWFRHQTSVQRVRDVNKLVVRGIELVITMTRSYLLLARSLTLLAIYMLSCHRQHRFILPSIGPPFLSL